jgi:hypothetical protein
MLPISASTPFLQASLSPSRPLGASRYSETKRLAPASIESLEAAGSQMKEMERACRAGDRGRRGVGKRGINETMASIAGSLICRESNAG